MITHDRRKVVKTQIAAGAINVGISIPKDSDLYTVHFSCNAVPASETAEILVGDPDGDVTHRDSFDLSASAATEVTRAYDKWTVKRNGTITVNFPNTGDVVDRIIFTYEIAR